MKKITFILTIIVCMVMTGASRPATISTQSSTVICLDNHWLKKNTQAVPPDNQWDIVPNNDWLLSFMKPLKATVLKKAEGNISVHKILDLKNKTHDSEVFIEFNIGIYEKSGGTMKLFSTKNYHAIKIQDVLKKCEVGDTIVIILKDTINYLLPYQTIEVVDGC